MNPASSLETKRKNKSLFFIFFKKGMNAPESISYMAAVVAGGCHFDPFILHQHSFLSTHIILRMIKDLARQLLHTFKWRMNKILK
jgi:hypothetical protein